MENISLPLPAVRCLSKEEAAQYLGIGITLLAELEIPYIKLGRRCLYDRVDLDAWIEEYKQREHGRAKKEATWPKHKKVSTGKKILATGGLQQRSQTAKEYAKALGLKSGMMPEALLAKIRLDAFREHHFGIKPQRLWQEAVVRYLAIKVNLRSFKDVQRICRLLDPYLGHLTLDQITGDVIWSVVQGQLKKGNTPATVNRYLAIIRNLLKMAREEWQWIDSMPKIRLLTGEVERDR